ncbi:plasmid pRiA4b ORF-3 family protein [Sphingomonas sp. UYP23]
MQDPFDPDSFIITANVHILGIEPRIERMLELPVNLNFAQFHEVLQAAFGWTDSHLHRFDVGGLTIGAPEFDDGNTYGPRTIEAGEVRMQDLSFPYGEDASLQALYVYDYGDDWHHRIILRRRMRDPNVSYPRCIEGVRSGPPEDVGGYSGYADFLEAWLDPEHEEHKAVRRWAGRKFEPERLDLEAINKAITKAMRAAKGSYRFRHLRL